MHFLFGLTTIFIFLFFYFQHDCSLHNFTDTGIKEFPIHLYFLTVKAIKLLSKAFGAFDERAAKSSVLLFLVFPLAREDFFFFAIIPFRSIVFLPFTGWHTLAPSSCVPYTISYIYLQICVGFYIRT